MIESREEKLPRWAQDRLHQLRGSVDHLKGKLEYFSGEIGTNLFLTEGLEERPLPAGYGVMIKFGPQHWNRVTCRLRKYPSTGEQWLEVMGGSAISIEPSSSNVIHVRLKP